MTTTPSEIAAFLAALAIPDVAKRDLACRMDAPSRRYHTLSHLALLWTRHRRFAPLSGLDGADDALIAFAIAYHDAVYEDGARDNEARSASLWLEVSADGTVCREADRLWVADTILATADHFAARVPLDPARPRDRARQWVVDLDLTPLGEDAATFDANMADLAAEMTERSPADREAKLAKALRHFSSARPLYVSAPLAATFDAAAQANFARHQGPSCHSGVAPNDVASIER